MGVYLRVDTQPITTAGIYHSPSLGLISLSSDGTNWITIADKNLGATTVYNYGDAITSSNSGNYFQWGNNYEFPYRTTVQYSSTTKVSDVSAYGPNNYYSSQYFIKQSAWMSTYNADLWGNTTNTSIARKGPCNSGYHISSYDELISLYNTMTSFSLPTANNYAQYLFLPFAGYFDYSNGQLSGEASDIRISCSTGRSASYIYALHATYNTYANVINNSYTGYGLNIRPFANTPVQPDNTRTVLYQPS